MEKTILNKTIFGCSVLLERHEDSQGYFCSYCHDLLAHAPGSFGLWVPKDKTFNSWWVFWLVGKKNKYYFRFTLHFLKKPNDSTKKN